MSALSAFLPPPPHHFATRAFAATLITFSGLGGNHGVAGEPAEPRLGVADCTVTTPTGDYSLAVLDFVFAGTPKDQVKWTYVGGLRAGRMRVGDGIGLREPGGWLELKDGKLSGKFLRVDFAGEITVDASVAGGAITGTAQLGAKSGTITGRLVSEADLAAINAVAKDKSWPAAQGPQAGGCSAQWTGVATIDDISGLRMRWRCEESDIGLGMGNIDRFMVSWGSATSRRTGSGCASPLVAGGRLYFKYFVPSPRGANTPEAPLQSYGGTETSTSKAMLDEAKTKGFAGDALPPYAAEKAFRCADDITVCMDAATGKTLWKAVVKGRGVNWQHHKAGYFDLSPAYAKGRIFVLGTSGWIYAFEAETGKPLWEVKTELDDSNALLVVGDVLIAPAAGEWGGYDVATGKLLWKAGGGRSMSTLSAWSSGGKDHLIGILGPNHARTGLGCIEVASGKVLWTQPINVITAGRGRGPGGITISGDRMLVYQDNGTGQKNAEMKPALAAYQLTPNQPPQPLWQITDPETPETEKAVKKDINSMGCIHGESVPVVVRGTFVFTPDLRVLDIATGKVLGQVTKGPRPGNGGYMQVIEDLVLVRQDGTHGEHAQFGLYKVAADGSVRSFTETDWKPPVGGATSSYHHPIFYPLVDGRMFLRQRDGIYCWDVRKEAK